MKVRWTIRAADDLIAICDYIARDSAQYATIVADRVFARVAQLETFPESGSIVPEYGRSDIRELFVHSYRIIHQILPDEVRVLTIVHGASSISETPP